MVEVEACLGPVVEEEHQETRAVVVVVEAPSQVRAEGAAVLACQGEAVVAEVLACQGGAGVVEVQSCLVKEVGEEEGEYRHDPVQEEGVGERGCLLGLEGVGAEVEEAYLHSGQGEEGQVVEGSNRVLAREQ